LEISCSLMLPNMIGIVHISVITNDS
jgi:hypothetical protein